MIQNEEKIIKAIKYELLGMCLDKDLEKEIDFHKKSIFSKLTEKYGFSIEEMDCALKRYQAESQDPYLFPFEFSQKSYFPSSKLIPLNEIISFSEYFTKNVDISAPSQNFFFGGSILYDLLLPSKEAPEYELHRTKALSLLTVEEIKKCKALYDQYNENIFKIFKYRAEQNKTPTYEMAIEYAKGHFVACHKVEEDNKC